MSHRIASIALLGGASLLSIGGIAALFAACGGDDGATGGPAPGSADMHCVGVDPQAVSQADCQFRPPVDAAVDAGSGSAAPDAASDDDSDFGATMFGDDGDDDDCKYHVSWTASGIKENSNVFFNVVATTLTDNKPATGANIFAEVYLSDTHEAPPTNQTAVENPPGTYKVGPIQFDMPGMWTVRFHLHEDCLDYADDSPHGHAAFFVDVP